ncbi:hypothetical protein JCM24511_07952 [Saitozyma sp. JCM 24511]|nr:hypothetical protein JCM24511_07952 [Saitozyma sp. JCM 24511]
MDQHHESERSSMSDTVTNTDNTDTVTTTDNSNVSVSAGDVTTDAHPTASGSEPVSVSTSDRETVIERIKNAASLSNINVPHIYEVISWLYDTNSPIMWGRLSQLQGPEPGNTMWQTFCGVMLTVAQARATGLAEKMRTDSVNSVLARLAREAQGESAGPAEASDLKPAPQDTDEAANEAANEATVEATDEGRSV